MTKTFVDLLLTVMQYNVPESAIYQYITCITHKIYENWHPAPTNYNDFTLPLAPGSSGGPVRPPAAPRSWTACVWGVDWHSGPRGWSVDQ